MDRLLEAWDRELEAHARALEAASREHAQEALARAALERREDRAAARREIAEDRLEQRRASDAALAAAVETCLRGLVAQAASGDDVGLAIPSGVRVAGALGGTSPAEIAALAAEARSADEDVQHPAQRSALWALGAGLMPHPADLAELLERAGRDPSWQEGWTTLAKQLDRAPDPSGPPKLRATAAGERLDVLAAEKKLLASYGGARVLTLVARPGDLTADLPKRCPPVGGGPKMGQAALDRVLDGLFSRRPG
jgi:hypothetical protein